MIDIIMFSLLGCMAIFSILGFIVLPLIRHKKRVNLMIDVKLLSDYDMIMSDTDIVKFRVSYLVNCPITQDFVDSIEVLQLDKITCRKGVWNPKEIFISFKCEYGKIKDYIEMFEEQVKPKIVQYRKLYKSRNLSVIDGVDIF